MNIVYETVYYPKERAFRIKIEKKNDGGYLVLVYLEGTTELLFSTPVVVPKEEDREYQAAADEGKKYIDRVL